MKNEEMNQVSKEHHCSICNKPESKLELFENSGLFGDDEGLKLTKRIRNYFGDYKDTRECRDCWNRQGSLGELKLEDEIGRGLTAAEKKGCNVALNLVIWFNTLDEFRAEIIPYLQRHRPILAEGSYESTFVELAKRQFALFPELMTSTDRDRYLYAVMRVLETNPLQEWLFESDIEEKCARIMLDTHTGVIRGEFTSEEMNMEECRNYK